YKRVVGFVEDDPLLVGGRIAGVKVYSSQELARVIPKRQVQKVLLALPSITRSERRQIIEKLEPLMVKVQSVPPIEELVN
ncbi:polysaccharide biosynthesis protein, partial [Klebsiella pneumoniae]|nr:polysaccharide biosynthesis protein [Klebsiella pneumoniae]